jgi:hypothetical protein
MSVSEILHQIEALPSEERFELVNKLVEMTEAGAPGSLCPPMTEAERLEFEKKLKQRPNLGAELAERIDRMKAGHAVDLEDVKALLQQSSKLGH